MPEISTKNELQLQEGKTEEELLAEAEALAAERMETWKRDMLALSETLGFFKRKNKKWMLKMADCWDVAQGIWRANSVADDKSIRLRIDGFKISFKSSKCKMQGIFVPSQEFAETAKIPKDIHDFSYSLDINGEFLTTKSVYKADVEFHFNSITYNFDNISFGFPSDWTKHPFNRSVGMTSVGLE